MNINPFGMRRCCRCTIERVLRNGGCPENGEVLRCPTCGDEVELCNGCWRWKKPVREMAKVKALK